MMLFVCYHGVYLVTCVRLVMIFPCFALNLALLPVSLLPVLREVLDSDSDVMPSLGDPLKIAVVVSGCRALSPAAILCIPFSIEMASPSVHRSTVRLRIETTVSIRWQVMPR